MPAVRKPRSNRHHRKTPPALANLGDLVITKRTRTAAIDLTPEERKFLDDPDWITEDEADAIMAERIFRAEGGRGKPIRQYLKERGIQVEG